MKNFKKLFKMVLPLLLVLSLIMPMGIAYADDPGEKKLSTSIRDLNTKKGTKFNTDDGEQVSWSELFDPKTGDGSVVTINEDNFNRLTSSEKTKFIDDVISESSAFQKANSSKVSEANLQNWWKRLQSTPGAGTRFMTQILENTKPDFVTANNIYAPFSGPIGTALALACIFICALLGLSIAMDIAYITLPMFRIITGDDGQVSGGSNGGSGSVIRSHLISANAKNAVKECESQGKQALGFYFKHQAIALILLGICLLYLAQGQLYVLVMMILDLLNGFLGF